MTNNPVIIALSLLSILFITTYAITLGKLYRLNSKFGKLFIDHIALQKFVDEQINNSKNDQDVHKENFIKFLSDSRDWAYEYIEDVQSGLNNFINEIEPEIKYFKEYSDTMALAPNYYSMKKITEEYEKLKNLLPSEEEIK